MTRSEKNGREGENGMLPLPYNFSNWTFYAKTGAATTLPHYKKVGRLQFFTVPFLVYFLHVAETGDNNWFSSYLLSVAENYFPWGKYIVSFFRLSSLVDRPLKCRAENYLINCPPVLVVHTTTSTLNKVSTYDQIHGISFGDFSVKIVLKKGKLQ